MAILKNTVINDTSGLRIPTGTTAQRPANPVDGDCRYNTDVGHVEYYYKGFWVDARTSKNGLEKNGLQLFLDISNPDSYPGNGTTWFDISDNGRNFTFDNTPVLTTDEGVTCYSTVGRRAEGPASNSFGITDTSGYTAVVVSRQVTPVATGSFRWEGGDGSTSSAGRGIFAHGSWSDNNHYFDQGGCCNPDQRVNTDPQQNDRWAVYVYRSLENRAERSIWRNGEKVVNNTTSAANISLNTKPAQVGNTREYGNTWDARLNSFLMYNRGLTDEEIINLTVAFRFRDGF